MSVITQHLEAHTQRYVTCHVYNQSSAFGSTFTAQ